MHTDAGPRTIGKYHILGTLGRGSMGMVYKAEDPEIGRIVAIKVLRKLPSASFLSTDSAIERFRIEARSAGNLRHPHIITIFDVDKEGDTPYIVMDYLEGEGLDAVIARHGRVDPAIMIHYLAQVAAGLDYAHSKGVIHRDIKPSNILVDKQENVFIVDFGVATISGASRPGEPVMGTPGYMSPEQILNEDIDHRSDIFSLGVIAFECLTGKRPYPGDDFTSVVGNILSSTRYSLTELAPSLPLTLEAEFERVLARDRKDRFPTAHEAIAAFASALGIEVQFRSAAQQVEVRRKRLTNWQPLKRGDDPAVAEEEGDGGWDSLPSAVDSAATVIAEGPINLGRPYKRKPGAMFSHVPDSLESSSDGLLQRLNPLTLSVAVVALVCVVLGGGILVLGNRRPNFFNPISPSEVSTSTSEPISVGNPSSATRDSQSVSEMSNEDILKIIKKGSPEPLLLQALRTASQRTLGGIIETSAPLLQSDSYVVRLQVLEVLASSKDKVAVPHILPLLDDHDPLVRESAAKALATLGDARALGYLNARFIKEDVPAVKEAIKVSIETIRGFPLKE